jgi:hypothetical protein
MTRVFKGALLLALCTLAGCVVNLAFDMQRTVAVASSGGATSVSQSQLVNLGDYKEIQDHRGSIQSLDLDSVDVVVQTVDLANRATSLNGTVSVRKSLDDPSEVPVQVGSLSSFKISQGSTAHLPGSPALDAFIYQQLQNGGTFYVVVSGDIDQAPIDVVLNVTLHASMGYDAGL